MVNIQDIIAGIDNESQIRVEVEIMGLYKSMTYGGIIDTGFSGGLAIPLATAVNIGLERGGTGNVVLADGSARAMPIFLAKARVGSRITDTDVLVMGTDVLIGMSLLSGYSVCFNEAKGKVTLEEDADIAKVQQLASVLKALVGR